MRFWSGGLVVIACVLGCSSSSSSPSGGGPQDASYNVPDGHAILGDGAAKMLYPVGGQCMRGSDCMYSGGCNKDMDGFPGGYCVADCGMGRYGAQNCPMGSTCTSLNADTPTCYKSCTADGDCRTGYKCTDIGAALTLTQYGGSGSKICYPPALPFMCNVNSDCPPTMPHCTGGYNPAEAGAGDAGDAAAPGDDGGPPMPGVGSCGP